MDKYRVAFFGTPKIAQGILETLVQMENVEVVVVVSQPDRKVGRKQVLTMSPVKQFCLDHHLECLQPEKVGEIADQLTAANLDFLITCAYGQFIPTKILQLAKREALNIHGSLLPKYRGGAPIQYAILNGDSQTGVSLMRMVAKMDAGPVFSTRSVAIAPDETSGTLFAKIEQLGRTIIQEDLVKIANKELTAVDQNEVEVSFAYNIAAEQEKIDWNKTNKEVDQLVRALSPRPGAYTMLGELRYKIGAVKVMDNAKTTTSPSPGTIVAIEQDGIVVQTSGGQVKILELQRPGKKMQSAKIYGANKSLTDLTVGSQFA